MNRIILIGNGFDLAHGLKTGYQDFMSSYWRGFTQKIATDLFTPYEDEFAKFERISGPESSYKAYLASSFGIDNPQGYVYQDVFGKGFIPDVRNALNTIDSFDEFRQLITNVNQASDLQFDLSFKNQFFKEISEQTCLRSWLGIENEYYNQLKNTLATGMSAEKLNQEFSHVKNYLKSYLTEICRQEINKNESIEEILDAPIQLNNIAISEQEIFLDTIGSMAWEVGEICFEERENHPEYACMNTIEANRAIIKEQLNKGKLTELLLPGRTLLLNFNYSNTAEKLYAQSADRADCELIHIHGELDNPDNPIIFGYGDEMDEHYKKLVDLNNNNYLQNIKSIRYLETDNYRRLLAFIASAPYQIYLMGHSCGNSDRTLLNTLFEHKNCISIKPFYHQRKDGSDDYIDTIQNISRNFKDAALMRDRVVNKIYCKPLPQKSEIEEPV
jgi:hypothetical protein